MDEFRKLGLSESLIKGVELCGFENPTPIQKKVIPLLLDEGKDVIALAGTGTGKTAAFGLPIIQHITNSGLPPAGNPQALILSPTRELCCQIAKDLKAYAAGTKGISVLAVYGGSPMSQQLSELRRKPQIIVATPGRLIDMLQRGALSFENLQILILDEADEMLSMGFKEELETILATTPANKRTCLFSATMPREIRSLAAAYLREAVEVSVTAGKEEAYNVEHRYYFVRTRDLTEALRRLLVAEPEMYGIVFCRTKETTKKIANILAEDGFSADALHGDLSQSQRDYVMQRFRSGIIKILVATDVAARGLDVHSLTHVVHYELPHDAEVYIHRSGRTGRAGKNGVSMALIPENQQRRVPQLDRKVPTGMKQHLIPDALTSVKNQMSQYITALLEPAAESYHIMEHVEALKSWLATLSKEELLHRVLSERFDEKVMHAEKSKEFKTAETWKTPGKGQFSDHGPAKSDRKFLKIGEGSFVSMNIPIGARDGFTKRDLLNLLNKRIKGKKFDVGKIKILEKYSTVELPAWAVKHLENRIA